MNRLVSIQYLRAFAALMVAFYHFEPNLSSYIEPLGFQLKFLYYFGYLGVDFFFIISGFVMWLTTHKIREESRLTRIYEFNIKRIIRIFLPYWPVMLLLIIGTRLAIWEDPNLLFRVVTLFPYDILKLPLSITWTLSFELFFYFSFSVLLLSNSLNTRMFFILAAFGAIFLLNTYFEIQPGNALHRWFYTPNEHKYIDYYLLTTMISPHVLQFLAGVVIAHIWLTYHHQITNARFARIFKHVMTFTVIAILIGAWYFKYDPHATHRISLTYVRSVFFTPIASIYIFSLLLNEQLNPTKERPFLLILGDGSYLIYLIHMPLYIILHQKLGNWAIEYGFFGLFAVISVYSSILIATAFFSKIIEIPLYRYFVNLLIKPKKKYAR